MSDGHQSADHVFVRTAESPQESSFECLDGCGRNVLVRHYPPELVVVTRGDPMARHRWVDLGVTFSASLQQP
jgi:hypothetical protein